MSMDYEKVKAMAENVNELLQVHERMMDNVVKLLTLCSRHLKMCDRYNTLTKEELKVHISNRKQLVAAIDELIQRHRSGC